MKRHRDRLFCAVVLVGMMMVAITGCSSHTSSSSGGYGGGSASASSDVAMAPQEDAKSPIAVSESSQTTGVVPNEAESKSVEENGDFQTQANENKLIKTGSMLMQVTDYDKTAQTIQSMVTAKGGYIESTDQSFYDGELMRGIMVIRIPAEQYDALRVQIGKLGRVNSETSGIQNVTETYRDLEASLKTKQIEEERLLVILGKAEKVEDLIAIEARLSEVRTEIELLNSQMVGIDRLVRYSTLNLDITEVSGDIKPISNNLAGRMKQSFIQSMNMMVRALEAVIVFASAMTVPIVCIGLIVLVVLLIKKIRRKMPK